MAGIGLGNPAGVAIDLPRTVVTPGKGVPVMAPQGIQQHRIDLDKAHEGRPSRVGLHAMVNRFCATLAVALMLPSSIWSA